MPDETIKKVASCSSCKLSEPDVQFTTRIVKGKCYPRTNCMGCTVVKNKKRIRKPSEATKQQVVRNSARITAERKSGLFRDKYIVVDARRSDQKFDRQFDLTRAFVKDLISSPCSYCGDTELMMTVDRKDNRLGHLKANVVGSCIRCNLIRRDMPYEAWLIVADSMRKARELGLFENWTGSIHKRLVVELADTLP